MTFQNSRSQGKPYFANDLERRIRIEQQLKFLAVGPVQTHCWLAIVSAHNSCNIIRHNSCNLANRHLFLSKYFSSKITYHISKLRRNKLFKTLRYPTNHEGHTLIMNNTWWKGKHSYVSICRMTSPAQQARLPSGGAPGKPGKVNNIHF